MTLPLWLQVSVIQRHFQCRGPTHTRITEALSPMAPQVPMVNLGSPLCPWCFMHSSWRGARHYPWHYPKDPNFAWIFCWNVVYFWNQNGNPRFFLVLCHQNPWITISFLETMILIYIFHVLNVFYKAKILNPQTCAHDTKIHMHTHVWTLTWKLT